MVAGIGGGLRLGFHHRGRVDTARRHRGHREKYISMVELNWDGKYDKDGKRALRGGGRMESKL